MSTNCTVNTFTKEQIEKKNSRYLIDGFEVALELEAGRLEGLDEDEVFMERLVANPIHVFKLIKRALKFIERCFPQIQQSFCKHFHIKN